MPEDEYLLVETCSLHINLCNKNSCADAQISITISIQALRGVFIQKKVLFLFRQRIPLQRVLGSLRSDEFSRNVNNIH